MENKYFQKVEDKYVFNLSRIFWHIFIALGTIVIVAGIAVFVYSVTPTFKKSVTKGPYPPEVKVTQADVEEQIAPPPPVATQSSGRPAPAAVPVVQSNDPYKPTYDALVAELKMLIPPDKYSWEGTGYYTYPYGENYWNYYHKDQYRVWVTSGGGVLDNLNTVYNRTYAFNYKKKYDLLNSYVAVIKNLTEPSRLTELNYFMANTGSNLYPSAALFNKLARLVPKFSQDDASYLETLIQFNNSNPRDGFAFIDMVDSVIGGFEPDQRVAILQGLVPDYRMDFNQNVWRQYEATKGFLPMASGFQGDQQPRALSAYYKVYMGKNADRQATINGIEQRFNEATASAEMNFMSKKMEKQEYRLKSLVGIGAGVAFISILAILLVFLSIQRSVRVIEDKVALK